MQDKIKSRLYIIAAYNFILNLMFFIEKNILRQGLIYFFEVVYEDRIIIILEGVRFIKRVKFRVVWIELTFRPLRIVLRSMPNDPFNTGEPGLFLLIISTLSCNPSRVMGTSDLPRWISFFSFLCISRRKLELNPIFYIITI